MASSSKSFRPRGYVSSSSAFTSPTTKPASTAYGKASTSVRFQIDRRSSASPGRSISFQKNRDNNNVNANAVSSKTMKRASCMCSPTTHPGSFRCSLHKNSGANRSRQIQSGLSVRSSSSALNFRRSAMTNSLVRIGGVEGADLVKRALSAAIRPSSHQQRRRLTFQARPSRLSVMSKAEEMEY